MPHTQDHPKRGDCSAIVGRRVLVLGLGRFGGGVGVTRWLAEAGAVVTVADSADRATLSESIEALDGLKDVTFRFGSHDPRDLRDVDLVVVNPAVRKSSPIFRAITERGLPWTTEVNLFCERCRGRVIGVTGTYGKSTTCAMLERALLRCRGEGGEGRQARYRDVYLGGNIGRSLLSVLGVIGPDDVVVLELSSAQLEALPRIEWFPWAAVVTNLHPHHMDRYDTFDDYVAAKLNVLGRGGRPHVVVVGKCDARAEEALRVRLGDRADALDRASLLSDRVPLAVPGDHNQDNAAVVRAVCARLGLSDRTVCDALGGFAGLPHRLETIRTLDGVTYLNDSKSTSPDATIRAVESLSCPIIAIIGGQRQRSDMRRCAAVLVERCRLIICVGESGPVMAKALRDVLADDRRDQVVEASGLADAVHVAHRRAVQGDAVLFSPGAPSFDAFTNFAARGRAFVEWVNALA